MKINHTAPTPNGKWRWRDLVTGSYLHSFSSRQLLASVRSFLAHNGREPMTDEQIEDCICNQMGLQPPYCDGTAAVPVMGVTFETLTRFFSTAKNWILGGAEMAPMELVNKRARICANCPRNAPAAGCSSCDEKLGQITSMDGVLPAGRRPNDHVALHNCSQCGCRLNLKVQLPISAYADDTAAYPEWCWVTKERNP